MRRTTAPTGGLHYYPPGSGPPARDGADHIIYSPRSGRPVVVVRADSRWLCPDCAAGLPASPAAARLHLDHQCKERNQ